MILAALAAAAAFHAMPACRYPMYGENGKWFNQDQTYLVHADGNKRPWRIKRHAKACHPSPDQFILSAPPERKTT